MVAQTISFHLSDDLTGQIIAHAQAGYPEEVCGLVSGKEGVAREVHRGRNVSPTPRVAYELDVDTLAKHIDFEEAGLELVAIYHSHPRGLAVPSETDIERATYPDAVCLICSLADRSHPTLQAFLIRENEVVVSLT